MRILKFCALVITGNFLCSCNSIQPSDSVAQSTKITHETTRQREVTTQNSASKKSKIENVPVKTIAGQYKVSSVRFSPKGDILSAGYEISADVKSWDVNDWSPKNGFGSKNNDMTTDTVLSFSHDGRFIAIGSGTRVKILDVSTGSWFRTLSISNGTPIPGLWSIDWSADNKLIAISKSNQVEILETMNWNHVHSFALDNSVSSVAFSPDANQLAIGCYDFTVNLYDVSSGRLKNNVQSGFGSEFVGISTAIAFSRNGVLAAPSSISSVRKLPQHDLIKVLLNQNQPIRLWDSKTGKLILSLTGQPVVRALAFSPDGSHLATGGIDHLLKLWDVSTGGLVHTFKGHKGAINSVDFSPDGRMLATGSSDTTIKIWRIQ